MLRFYCLASVIAFNNCQHALGQPDNERRVRDATIDAFNKWPTVPPKIPKLGPKNIGNCKAFLGFKPDLVRKDLLTKRDLLVKSLNKKEQQALKAYIIDEFPVRFAESTDECADGPVVLPDEILAGKKRADDFIAGLSSRASYAVVLDISSAPKGAKFSFAPKYSEDWTEVGTDVQDQKTWRGKYKYKVEKDGYLTIKGERTIMDGDRVVVTCSLTQAPVAMGDAATAAIVVVVPCNFARK